MGSVGVAGLLFFLLPLIPDAPEIARQLFLQNLRLLPAPCRPGRRNLGAEKGLPLGNFCPISGINLSQFFLLGFGQISDRFFGR